MPDGDSCGCAPGTVLKPGAAALRAAGAWDADQALCEACAGVRWSELGAGGCAHCAAGYYLVPAAPNGSASCRVRAMVRDRDRVRRVGIRVRVS